MMRRGRDFYGNKYEKAINMHKEGNSVKEIAVSLNISYSTAYHWVRGLRKPESGNLNDFLNFLQTSGPCSALDAAKRFPKHNELFLMASKRGQKIKRLYLGKKYRELGTWYYLNGQETLLEYRVKMLEAKISDMRDRLKNVINKE